VIEGVSMTESLDEMTGLSRKLIKESADPDIRPAIGLTDENGEVVYLPNTKQQAIARYHLPVGSNILVNEGDPIVPGTILAKIPRETTKTKDITGGLPRVAELFEARKPKEHAVISEIDGVVTFGKDTKGKRKVIVTPDVRRSFRVPDFEKQAPFGARGRPRARRRGVDGRRCQPTRHLACPR
jgi:DNA-directed RNA polymerase subunit beta'